MEDSEKPSFENFLSKPTTLTDHLMWQLGSLHVNEDVYRAAELVIGNLNEEGYLTATDDELLGLADEEQPLLLEPQSPASSELLMSRRQNPRLQPLRPSNTRPRRKPWIPMSPLRRPKLAASGRAGPNPSIHD